MVSSPCFPPIGQPQAVELINQAIARDRVAPAYLFAGPPGVGRSLGARYFMAQLLSRSLPPQKGDLLRDRLQRGNHPDVLWVQPTYLHQGKLLSAAEAASAGLKRKAPPQIRLEQVRSIAQFLGRPPLEAPRSLVVLEDADTMAEAAANGLLKTLEEPGKATLILIAPGPESLLPTLVSRCQRIPFYRLTREAMVQVLASLGHDELLQHPEVLAIAQGSPGAAIVAWEQIQAMPPEILDALHQPPRSLRAALTLARQIDQTLDTEAQLWLVDFLQHRYWQQMAAHGLGSHFLLRLEKTRQHLLGYAQPRLVWEVTLMELVPKP
ncbi:DNA polymerase III subunit delta' [Geitlerinema sp. PCC 7407]|uniref:DNA polymerase III subunit delta' n=1 Tax=Geitlerinema sp. PCC 7407 TaxID=1173025 RepID=UPI00029FE0DC|nr:DNA polymerase III subunit delta' [Geitlerinema sp. PCC 7407]AFY67212.1 DNA polymerase III, delta prime subunit [Geitlerinema sp. PCC 7407]